MASTLVDDSLPFSAWWPLVAGALVGVVLRLGFSGSHGLPDPMHWAFIYLTPMAVGAVTVYLAERQERRTFAYYAWAPVIATAIFVLGTLLILVEGLICAVLIVPLFAVLGLVGGLIMGIVCRVTNWPRHAAYAFAVLPLLVGIAAPEEAHDPHEARVATVARSIVVAAPADVIWRHIREVRDIRPEEVGDAWIYRIGVPLPVAGVTQQEPSGLVRKITMGKRIHFDQVVADWDENRRVRWTYRFDEDSFPAGALDDHVRIGGRYFDLVDTEYTLVPVDARTTSLSIRIRYRVSTDFDWYANALARILVGNFEEVILRFYDRRAAR
jgi:hypothetical protein